MRKRVHRCHLVHFSRWFCNLDLTRDKLSLAVESLQRNPPPGEMVPPGRSRAPMKTALSRTADRRPPTPAPSFFGAHYRNSRRAFPCAVVM